MRNASTSRMATRASVAGSDASETRLSGWRLALARSVVFSCLGVLAVLYIATIPTLPGLVDQFAIPCPDVFNTCLVGPRQVAPLARLGITPHGLALALVVLTCLAVPLTGGVAALLIWRRSDDWMALLVALTLALMPATFVPIFNGLTGIWQTAVGVVSSLGFPLLLLLAAIFPSGRFVPRWLWVPVVVTVFISHLNDFSPILPALSQIPNAVQLPVLLACILSLVGGQIYRYRRVATPPQRQQIKWAVFGIVLTLLVNQLFWQPAALVPALQAPDSLYSILLFPDSWLIIAIVSVSFAVAILRYRLYDVDVIINRTLVYGSLTAILAAVYFGVVYGAQTLIGHVNHAAANSPVIIVGSTLLIAALFTPLRRRIQAVIDRRFYRSRYDATKTLARFAATLRAQTDLGDLREHLLGVVDDTMQPAYVSLWLAPVRMAPAGEAVDEPARQQGEAGRERV